MHSIRLGLALIIIGVALPLVCLPLLDGYRQKAGWFTNIQEMSLPITRDRLEPDFREVASLDGGVAQVEYGKTGMTLGFPSSMSKDDIAAAIKAESRFQRERDLPKFMRFYGWTVAQHGHGVSVPFKYITSFGVLLAFLGLILLVLRATKVRRDASVG
jgi:hypothetical protein